MAGLRDAGFAGRVVWLGSVKDRTASIRASPLSELHLEFNGIGDDSHSGQTRQSCVRVEVLYDVGTEIRNTRQVSVLSCEDLAQIAKDIGAGELSPALLGANIVIEGVPDFTLVPPNSRIQFEGGATLTVDMVNAPCNLPAREIEMEMPGTGRSFRSAAKDRRGITAWVEREGPVKVGRTLRLFIPDQSPWPGISRQEVFPFEWC